MIFIYCPLICGVLLGAFNWGNKKTGGAFEGFGQGAFGGVILAVFINGFIF